MKALANQDLIHSAYSNPERQKDPEVVAAVAETIAALDRGELRVAERRPEGGWHGHQWIKQAILLYFQHREMETIEVSPFEWRDKIPLKANLAEAGVRVVPLAIACYGSFLEAGVVMMPSFVNIGAHGGRGTMIDTWPTVGSCAQIGRDVHLSGGVRAMPAWGDIRPLSTPTQTRGYERFTARCAASAAERIDSPSKTPSARVR